MGFFFRSRMSYVIGTLQHNTISPYTYMYCITVEITNVKHLMIKSINLYIYVGSNANNVLWVLLLSSSSSFYLFQRVYG